MKKKASKFSFYAAVVTAMIMAIVFGSAALSTTTISYAAPEIVDKTPEKIADLKASVVDKIAGCESAGHDEEDGLIIFDTNNRASIGQLQFQITTVQHYEKTLYGQDITRKDAELIALDTTKAKALAQDIVFKADGLGNWLNCGNKLGLRAQVDAIKFLEK